jgi:vanillate O-demethylase monooxygenase subunit
VTEGIFQSLITAFNEDRDMITAQHEAILRNPGAPMLPLGIDAALVRYRKLLEEAVQREQAG